MHPRGKGDWRRPGESCTIRADAKGTGVRIYPYKFEPIYKERIWGGRNLERLFGRVLPQGRRIGESWELADLEEGVSVVCDGPEAGETLTRLTGGLGGELLGQAKPQADGRFPLLLKLLDANDMLSLQVHPDERAAREIGGKAAPKTECWYVLESRGGSIYKGVKPGVTGEQFLAAIRQDKAADLVRRLDVAAGDFHFLPAGTVHALGGGVIVAEVQTPSDTTYRLTDWDRGRPVHVEQSMRCIRFDLNGDKAPGARGDVLVVTEFFTVSRRKAKPQAALPAGRCTAIMILKGGGRIRHDGEVERVVPVRAGETVLLPAALQGAILSAGGAAQGNGSAKDAECQWLEITLPER